MSESLVKVDRFILLTTKSSAIYVTKESCIYLRIPSEVRSMLKGLGLDVSKRHTYDVQCLLTIEDGKFRLVYTLIPRNPQLNERPKTILAHLKRFLKLNGDERK